MIEITQRDVQNGGGILSALAFKSAQYVGSVMRDALDKRFLNDGKIDRLHRTVVHKNAHIDEYMAELLFRAALHSKKINIGFKELSIFSSDADYNCVNYWPNAAVFGMGGVHNGGAEALFLFDEHRDDGGRARASSAQLVADKIFFKWVPKSILPILQEVNRIDSVGNAHDTNMSNILKTMHDTLFLANDEHDTVNQVLVNPNASWKRSVVDACLTALIFALENGKDVLQINEKMLQSVGRTFNHYIARTPHRSNRYFEDVRDRLKQDYLESHQLIHNRCYWIVKDGKRQRSEDPQRLLLSRVAYALDSCWGERVATFVMMHFWETLFQEQMCYRLVMEDLHTLESASSDLLITPRGRYERRVGKSAFVIEFSPNPSVLSPKKPLTSYVKKIAKEEKKLGLIIVSNRMIMNKVIQKDETFPKDKWSAFVDQIDSIERGRWYTGRNIENGSLYGYTLNGNYTYQNIEPSELDIDDILRIVNGLT